MPAAMPSSTRVELVTPREREEALAAERVERDVDAPRARLRCRSCAPRAGSVAPFVVIDEVDVAARRASPTSTGRWARTVGSPPVRRMPSTPNRSTKQPGEPLDLLEA